MNLRVLVVDEDEPSVRAMERTLAVAALELTATSDVWELAPMLSERTFDVVIGDLLTVLLARHLVPTARCLLLTGVPDEVSPSQLTALGISGVIEKPWSDQRVLELVAAK